MAPGSHSSGYSTPASESSPPTCPARHARTTGRLLASSSSSGNAPTSVSTYPKTPPSRPGKHAEESYKLTPEYRQLFDRVLAYAREHVTDPTLNHVHRRVRWWSAIALLRSIASSPAAAEQTLLNRSDLNDIETHRGRRRRGRAPGVRHRPRRHHRRRRHRARR